MIEKMKTDDQDKQLNEHFYPYLYCYQCYGVKLELYLPDTSWQPDIALLQTHVPGIEYHQDSNRNNNNSNIYNKHYTPFLDNSLSSLFWKLAHPEMTFQVIIDCDESHKQKNNQHEENKNNINVNVNASSSLTIEHRSEFHKIVYLCLASNLDEDSKKIWKNDLPHFIYALLRQYWIETGLAPVHSLCVAGRNNKYNSKDNNRYQSEHYYHKAQNSLIIGHSGTGKSTLATELLNLNWPVHSLDRTLVHIYSNSNHDYPDNLQNNRFHLTQLAGTQVLSLRKNSTNINTNINENMNGEINLNSNSNTNINKDRLLQSLNHPDSFQTYRVMTENEDRIVIQIEQNSVNNIHTNMNTNTNTNTHYINRIYLLNINDGEFKVSPLSPLSALHTLYPYFMDKIKEDIILGGGEIVFSGKITEKVHNQLIQKLKNLVESIPVATLWGRAEQCAQYLASHE